LVLSIFIMCACPVTTPGAADVTRRCHAYSSFEPQQATRQMGGAVERRRARATAARRAAPPIIGVWRIAPSRTTLAPRRPKTPWNGRREEQHAQDESAVGPGRERPDLDGQPPGRLHRTQRWADDPAVRALPDGLLRQRVWMDASISTDGSGRSGLPTCCRPS